MRRRAVRLLPSGTPGRLLALAALAAVIALYLVLAARRNHFFDLRVYYGAVTHWVHGGELYDYRKPVTPYGFTYPPFAALTMLPMTLIPLGAAQVVSVLLAVGTTGVTLWWLLAPTIRRHGWPPWFALAVAGLLVAALEPVRETVTFGQVNTVLLCLVVGDLLLLVARGSRWGGIGIGLATAIKLTPGIFIGYLLVTRRWRAAATAVATAAGATVLAAAVAPDATREYWFSALPNTDRVGSLAFISNQSLRGMIARLGQAEWGDLLWPVTVLLVLGVWVWRVGRHREVTTGLALTGVVGGLVSPVTWIHHLVWLLPALLLLVDRACAAPAGSRHRRRLLVATAVLYVLACSGIVWIWELNSSGVLGFLGGNLYVWLALALVIGLPVSPPVAGRERG
ncbi:MAG TPA: glycosyltransferase 87 family protein [Micromonospora sp.]